MKTVELFSGTQSFSKVARELGHKIFCVDDNSKFNNDLTLDLSQGITHDLLGEIATADVVWMSPPCTTFSMASGNKHWTADRKAKTDKAVLGKRLLDISWKVAEFCMEKNIIFFIENPRARARWFLPEDCRKTAWYCQYGDSRAKPTDIWTNLDWTPKTCKNGNKECHHEPAPRGSKTGTEGLKGSVERSIIPPELFHEIFKLIHMRNKKREEGFEP